MRAAVLLPVVFAVACASGRVVRADPAIRVYESPKGGEITEGETTLEVDPDVGYRTLANYQGWVSVFPDLRRVTITQQSGVDARVSLDYADKHRNNIHFHNDPVARKIWFENLYSRADMWAELVFLPGDRPGTTKVHARVYADVKGLASMFVTESKLRRGRTDRIRGDLTHLQKYFASVVATAARD